MTANRTLQRSRRSFAAFLAAVPLALAVPPAAGSAAAASPRTELERSVGPGDRLEVRNYSGRVVVTAGRADRVRVQAEHAEDESIVAERYGVTLRVVPRSWERDSGEFAVRLPDTIRLRDVDYPPPPVTLRLEVPDWLPVTVEMPYGDVTVTGSKAAVGVTVLTGDVEVSGAGSPVTVVALSGTIRVEGADGRLTVEGIRGPITVRDCGGDLRLDTTSGDVTLERLRTVNAEVRSLSGAIVYRGPLDPRATYELTSHSGDLTLELPAGEPDAQFSVRALEGTIDADLPAAPSDDPHRLEVTTGTGSARVRLWTFTGTVSIRRR